MLTSITDEEEDESIIGLVRAYIMLDGVHEILTKTLLL